MVYLVRHAHAGRKSEWQGPDRARPLSAEGRMQALGLIDRLRDHRVRRVLSSPAERCLQTVEPLAGRLGLAVEPSDALGVDGSAAGVLELLASPGLHQTVLCTHGEIIGEVFDRLRDVGIELSDQPRWPKGSIWVIGHDGGQAWKGSYLRPLSVPAAGSPWATVTPGSKEDAG
ncbi:MAG TPA: phosphoglycerate mutase family protein [Actinomycetes bacterium]|nr:phosphoglycerate mutase family protein [Actinomycetes bacterium]